MTNHPFALCMDTGTRSSVGSPGLPQAYFGFQLEAMLPTTCDPLVGRVLLLTRVGAAIADLPGVRRSAEVRYVVWPGTAENGWQERTQCYLLFRMDTWPAPGDQQQKQAKTFALEMQHLLANILPGYRFTPLASEEQVAQALSPFPVKDTGEIRRLMRSPLDTLLPPPFAGLPDADLLVDLMLRQSSPTLLSICLEPTEPDLDFLLADEGPPPLSWLASAGITVQRQALNGEQMSDDMHTSMQEDPADQRLLSHRVAALCQRAFYLRVQLASPAPLGEALISSVSGEVGGPGRLTAEITWQEPSHPLAAGALWVRPRSIRLPNMLNTEFELAVANLKTLDFLLWGPFSPHIARRAVFLSDLSEATRLFSLPFKAPWLSMHTAALQLPYSAGISSGVKLGVNQARGGVRPVRLPQESRLHHLWLVGQTGTGKSTLMESALLQDIQDDRGVILMDPHGDLIEQVLGKIPIKRKHDVILFDPADTAYPVGINPLEAKDEDEQALVVSSLLGLLDKLYDPHHQGITGPRFQHAVRNGLLTVMSRPGGTLIEFVRLFTDECFLHTLLRSVKDPLVGRYWTDQIAQTDHFHRSEVLDWIISKFGHFVTDPTIRRIIGQSESSFSFRAAMDSGMIVLLNLAKGRIGGENANFLGQMLLPKILHAALSRASLPARERRQVGLYIDEFQNYTSDSLAWMLAEVRKYGVALTLANQHIGQLTQEIRDAVIGNISSVLSFRLGLLDAGIMEQILAPSPITAQHIMNLPNYTAYGRALIQGQRSPVFTLETEPVARRRKASHAEEIRAFSRRTYGRERAYVDAVIKTRAQF